MMIRPTLLAVLAAALAFAAPARAQTPDAPLPVAGDTVRQITLSDGSVIYGRIESADGDRVVIVTTAGARVEVARANVRSVTLARGRVRNGEMWREDPNPTRLFFAPTGRNLRAGEGYFGVYELFFPFVTFGVTDRITIAAGTPVIPDLIAEFAYVAPKLQLVASPKTNIAVGAFAFLSAEETGAAGILYGVGTFGGADNALTVGGGLPFASGEGILDTGVFMLGGETRIARGAKLLTENYFVPGESGAVISGGVRFFGEGLSADFGLAGFIGDGGLEGPLPVLNFVYSWGKK
ncbi:MAG TPA: hypothetical protein VE913_03605 [Longimicrobium sp.]|nr:hypothetical protein [Longimicrobium sp.]